MTIGKNAVVVGFLLSTVLIGTARKSDQSSPVSGHAWVIATIQLSQWKSPDQNGQIDSTVAFISDDSVALRLCQPYLDSSCRLVVTRFSDGSFHTLAQTEGVDPFASLSRSGDGCILASDVQSRVTQVYSRNLDKTQQVPNPLLVSGSGEMMAAFTEKNRWRIYRIRSSIPSIEEVRDGLGELQALSDKFLVMRENDTIHTETMDGKVLGSFKVKSARKCGTTVEVARRDRLYIGTCDGDRIVDFSGKVLVRLRGPRGWGSLHRWSADGRRMLYDHYTRNIPFLQNVGEYAIAIATLGLGVANEEANGEEIRILDTDTGNTCFDWEDRKHLSRSGELHADISPTGDVVAIVTGSTLSIYRLPDQCAKY